MPSLLDHRSTIGRASDIPAIVTDAFEDACLGLLTLSYQRMKSGGTHSRDWKETHFSAVLMNYMLQIRDELDLAIKIDPEHHIYRVGILEGLEDPDTADRIDIRLMGAWVKEDIYYGIEGKVLVQRNWQTRNASALRRRYIITGIDNYKNGNYSGAVLLGCIVGYVVEGNPQIIATQLNRLLSYYQRRTERLNHRRVINGCDCCYTSTHSRITDGREFRIAHILLDCT